MAFQQIISECQKRNCFESDENMNRQDTSTFHVDKFSLFKIQQMLPTNLCEKAQNMMMLLVNLLI
jgi:hypothetical protein